MDILLARKVACLFRGTFLKRLALEGAAEELKKELAIAGCEQLFANNERVVDILDEAYEYLLQHYQCEYVFKNVILNNIFLSRHSFETSTYLSEFMCGQARVDAAIFNGTSTAYEIKTEYDSFEKLERQLTEYLNVFDRVFVVTTYDKARKLLETLPCQVGILALRKGSRLSRIRDCQSNKMNVVPEKIFDCLRKSEYLNAIRNISNRKIDLPSGIIYSECKNIFGGYPPEVAHDAMVEQMRLRCPSQKQVELLQRVPQSLKHAWVELKGTQRILQNAAEGILAPA